MYHQCARFLRQISECPSGVIGVACELNSKWRGGFSQTLPPINGVCTKI